MSDTEFWQALVYSGGDVDEEFLNGCDCEGGAPESFPTLLILGGLDWEEEAYSDAYDEDYSEAHGADDELEEDLQLAEGILEEPERTTLGLVEEAFSEMGLSDAIDRGDAGAPPDAASRGELRGLDISDAIGRGEPQGLDISDAIDRGEPQGLDISDAIDRGDALSSGVSGDPLDAALGGGMLKWKEVKFKLQKMPSPGAPAKKVRWGRRLHQDELDPSDDGSGRGGIDGKR